MSYASKTHIILHKAFLIIWVLKKKMNAGSFRNWDWEFPRDWAIGYQSKT